MQDFHGIPLKIYDESINITLVDSLQKRVNFLNECIEKLNLKNIVAIHGRAEDLARNNKFREKFDYSVSRAVAPLNILLEYLSPYTKINGKIIAMKANNIDEEIERSKKAMEILKCKINNIYDFDLPDKLGNRKIIIIDKIENTPKKYPRNPGIPKKKPL